MPEYRCSAQSALIHSSCCRGAHCCAVATALGERLLRSLSAPQLQGLGDEHQSQYRRCPERRLCLHLHISTCNCSRLHTSTKASASEDCGTPLSVRRHRTRTRRRFATAAVRVCQLQLCSCHRNRDIVHHGWPRARSCSASGMSTCGGCHAAWSSAIVMAHGLPLMEAAHGVD